MSEADFEEAHRVLVAPFDPPVALVEQAQGLRPCSSSTRPEIAELLGLLEEPDPSFPIVTPKA